MSSEARRKERGAALLVALCVLSAVALLTASAVALSKLSAESCASAAGRTQARYLAESCASRAVWLLMNDISLNRERSLGLKDSQGPLKGGRFAADGRARRFALDGGEGVCSIFDMVSGPDVSGVRGGLAIASLFGGASGLGQPSGSLPGQPQAQGLERGQALPDDVRVFINRLQDYCDARESSRPGGMKRRDYEAAGLKGLPRNGPLKFREELLLIPGFEKLFPASEDGLLDYFAPVPPEGLPAVWMKPSFFSVNKAVLKLLGNLSEDEAVQAAKARSAWLGERPFGESLSPGLYKKLESAFSFTESGCYRIVAKGFSEEGGVATLVMSLRVMAQPQGSGASYYEWMQY